MGIITRMLKQTAVYWSPATPDAQGVPTWGSPAEISVRWEDKSEEFRDSDGELRMSKAVVYVASDVEVNGVLLLSALNSSVDEDDPKANDGAYEIRSFSKLPNLKATEFLRTAML